MASAEDILIAFNGRDNVSKVASRIRSNVKSASSGIEGSISGVQGKLRNVSSTLNGMALQQIGQQALSFGKDAVSAAATSEKEWGRLKANIQSTSGALSSNEITKWTKEFSNSMGRAVSDTRGAANTLAQYGMKWNEIKTIMPGVAQIAAGTGKSEQESAQMLISAMAGRATAFKKLGLNIDDYKDKTTGAINKTKLLTDIQKKYGKASEEYTKTAEAQMNKLNNTMAAMKTSIGKGILAVMEPLLPIITGIADALNGWLAPLTPIIGGLVAIGGGLALIGGYYQMISPIVDVFKQLVFGVEEVATQELSNVEMIEAESAAYDQLALSATSAAEAKTAAASAGLEETAMSSATYTAEDINAAAAHAGPGAIPASVAEEMGTGVEHEVTMVEKASPLKTMGPEVAAEAAGAEVTGIALDGLSAAISSMLVPLLAISAVVAIMIPIVAGLAAEALLFVKGIQILIKSLHFEDTDLSGGINGLKQIGQALWQLANAMVAMSITAVVATVVNVMNALGIGINQIASAAGKIKAAIPMINSFANVQGINQGAIQKLKSVCEGLNAMSQAVHSLSATSGEIAWDRFWQVLNGGMIGNLKQAHDKLIAAVPVLNSFASMPSVNEEATKKLKSVAEGLKNASDAIHSLSGMSGEVSWDNFWSLINGGMISNLRQAHDKLWEAARVLATFQNMPAIPNGVGNKIQRVTWTLNNVKNAIKTLNGNGGDFKVNPNTTKGLGTAISTIRTVAGQLRSLSTIANIPTNTGTKLQRITWTMNNVKSATKTFTGFPSVPGGVTAKVSKAVSTIRNVASQLRSLGNVNVGKASSMVAGVRNAFNQIISTLNSIRASVVPAAVNVGHSIVNGIRQGLSSLPGTLTSLLVNAINTAAGAGASAAWTAGSRMGTSATNAFRSTLKLADVASQEMSDAVTAINNGSGALADAARKAAENAVAAAKEGADRHSPGAIARMWGQEMLDSATLMTSNSNKLIRASKNISGNVVDTFSNGRGLSDTLNSLNNVTRGRLTPARLKNIKGLGNNVTSNRRQSTVNEVHIHEGAIQLDARNLTTKESKQIMINALEGLNAINTTGA